ncbi:hypothetical protein E4T42_07457 [Aureobasidium subglaciale]|nr:hypothetical protein E4T42_07457 [Aureobasidium subglaciale]
MVPAKPTRESHKSDQSPYLHLQLLWLGCFPGPLFPNWIHLTLARTEAENSIAPRKHLRYLIQAVLLRSARRDRNRYLRDNQVDD